MTCTWAYQGETARILNLTARGKVAHRVAFYVKMNGVWQRYGKGSARNQREAAEYFAPLAKGAKQSGIPCEFRPVPARKWRSK